MYVGFRQDLTGHGGIPRSPPPVQRRRPLSLPRSASRLWIAKRGQPSPLVGVIDCVHLNIDDVHGSESQAPVQRHGGIPRRPPPVQRVCVRLRILPSSASRL